MSFADLLSSFGLAPRATRQARRRRQRQAARSSAFQPRVERLEARLALATFSEAGTQLNLNFNVADKSVAIVSAGSSYTLTLTGDTWSGTDSVNVTGNGNATLTVTTAGLAAFDTINIADTANDTTVNFNDSGLNTYGDTFSIILDAGNTFLKFNGATRFVGSAGVTANVTTNVLVNGGGLLSAVDGAVNLTATGTGAANVHGIDVLGGTISTSGTGSISLTGTGANSGSDSNHGVVVSGSSSQITSSGGAVLVNGTGGGSGSSHSNYGVYVVSGGTITSAGTGSGATVTVKGFGGNTGGSGSSNHGVVVSGSSSQITSSGGAVLVEGTGTSNSAAVVLAASGAINSGSNAAITITADSLDISGSPLGTINSGSGTTTIKQKTAGTFINLGGSDVLTGSPLTLGLTNTELNQVTAGTIQIGDANSGNITVSSNITQGDNLSITSGANIVLAANVNTDGDGAAGNLSFNSPVVISEGSSISIDADGTSSDGVVSFFSTINGTAGGGSENLTITGGTGGSVGVVGAIGASAALGTLTVTNSNAANFTGNITTTGNVNITAQNAIGVQGINAGASTITIAANQDNSGTQGFTQASGTTIQTTNSTAGAVSVTVNTSASTVGTGTAALQNISAGSGASAQVTINANSGNMTQGSGTVLSAPAGTVSLSGSSTSSAGSMGTSASPMRTTAAFVNVAARGVAGHDYAYVTETDGATFSGTGSVGFGSNLTFSNLSGTLIVGGSGIATSHGVVFGSGHITLNSVDGVQLDAPVTAAPLSGLQVTINANTAGTDGAGFVMNSGSSITNLSSATNAVLINVNNGSGGTGGAALRAITIANGGSMTIQTNNGGNTTGGSITQASGTLSTGVGSIALSTGQGNSLF